MKQNSAKVEEKLVCMYVFVCMYGCVYVWVCMYGCDAKASSGSELG